MGIDEQLDKIDRLQAECRAAAEAGDTERGFALWNEAMQLMRKVMGPQPQPERPPVDLDPLERQFLALAIQGLCMRGGPQTFPFAIRIVEALDLTSEMETSLKSWRDYSRAERADST